MPKIVSIGTALPKYSVSRHETKAFARNLYGEAYHDIDRLLAVFDNASVDTRHFCVPKEWFGETHGFEEKNNLYIENGLALSQASIENCLANTGADYGDIDMLLFVSTTGLSTPTMDARLIQMLPFRKNVRRMPLWGVGCAGGASSLAWAMELANANPNAKILIVVTEMCGLTFIRGDLSKAALVSSAIFADGSASVLITGDNVKTKISEARPCLVSSETETLENSLDVMGFHFIEQGFKVILSRDVPEITKTFMKNSIAKFLQKKNLPFSAIKHFITHPGGAKVLEAYKESLGLTDKHLRHAYEILRTCGNMSAATVLFILKKFLDELPDEQDSYGLIGALGPGFSSELVLLHWD
jgi:alkylresorcinol/alkylpyrone synthase